MSEFKELCCLAGISNPMLLFVGGGNMASALINGCITSGFATPSEIAISCRSKRTLEKWKSQGFTNVFTSTSLMVSSFPDGIMVLAVKPQSRHEVFESLVSGNASLQNCPLVISILAGVSTAVLEKEMEIVRNFASKVGICLEVDSQHFNAYSAIAGSAPAWAYMFIESLADGGVLAGCSRETALKLAAQSVMGAAEMVLSTGDHPAALKDKVCSPGGTTISGVRKLEESGFRFAVMEAVKAASERADNMS